MLSGLSKLLISLTCVLAAAQTQLDSLGAHLQLIQAVLAA